MLIPIRLLTTLPARLLSSITHWKLRTALFPTKTEIRLMANFWMHLLRGVWSLLGSIHLPMKLYPSGLELIRYSTPRKLRLVYSISSSPRSSPLLRLPLFQLKMPSTGQMQDPTTGLEAALHSSPTSLVALISTSFTQISWIKPPWLRQPSLWI